MQMHLEFHVFLTLDFMRSRSVVMCCTSESHFEIVQICSPGAPVILSREKGYLKRVCPHCCCSKFWPAMQTSHEVGTSTGEDTDYDNS